MSLVSPAQYQWLKWILPVYVVALVPRGCILGENLRVQLDAAMRMARPKVPVIVVPTTGPLTLELHQHGDTHDISFLDDAGRLCTLLKSLP